ncbi:MAG: right-handed parallel beta-helix repeat-containing protein, partial [Thermoplasmata archaeon]
LIEGDVIVDFGVTLTIEPGVRVRFKQNLYLYVVGNLTALGSAADPISFTADVGNNRGHWRSIRINASGHLRMNHCEIKHAKNGIYLFHSQGNIIENTSMSKCSNYGIYVRESDYTKVKNCDLGPDNWMGIYFHRSMYGEVDSCSAFMSDYQGFAVSESSYIAVTNTDAYNNGINGLHVYKSSDMTVSNCDMYDNKNMGMGFANSSEIAVDNCRVSSNFEMGIYLPECSDITITNSLINEHDHGIYGLNCSDITVGNTEIHTNKKSGITFLDSSHNTIENSLIYDSGNFGIYLTKDPVYQGGSSYNTVSNTEAYGSLYGIMMRFSSDNTVENCHSHSNTNGIIAHQCANTTVSNSNISHNLYYGISYIGSSNGYITQNELYGNYYGIFLLAPSAFNLVHHNYVRNHTYYAYGSSLTNQWDDGAEGNYWGDYDGVDLDGNGIGDTPHPIHSAGQDRYPLVDFNNTRFKILSSLPSNESTLVPVTASVRFSLSESALRETFEGNITISPSTPVLNHTWEDADKNLTLTLPVLTQGQYYVVTVQTNATGISNRSLRTPYVLIFYTENPSDTAPPQISDVQPTGSDVLVNTTSINITFNEVMIRSATEPSFNIVPWIPGELTWDNTTLVFTPDWDFEEMTTYTVTINASQARDAVGQTLDGNANGASEGSPADDYSWQFTTQRVDFTPPRILNVEPTGNMVDVNSSIKLYFSELMNKTTVETAFSFTNGTAVWTSANGTWGRSAYIMTFTPSEPFNFLQDYTVTIRGIAEDRHTNTLDGNGNGTGEGSPADDYVFGFTSIYDPAIGLPTVIDASPSGTDLPLNIEIAVNFSQTMNQATVEGAFTISDGTNVWNETHGTFVWENNTCIFIPGFALAYNTTYTVRINMTAANFVGYQLDGNKNLIPEDYTLDAYSWEFKTEAPAELIILYMDVDGQQATDESQVWYADAGAMIAIGVDIRNTGYFSTASGFTLRLQNQSGQGQPINITLAPLEPNLNSGIRYFQWQAPTSLGDHFVLITVDADGEIKEVNEDNNSFVLHFAVGPDYIPANVTVNGMDASDPDTVWYADYGEPVAVGVEAKNAGFSGVSSDITYSIAFWNATASGVLQGSSPFGLVTGLPGLGPDASSGPQSAFWFAPNAAGDFYAAVIIDYGDTTLEIDEDNNMFFLHFASAADYTVTDVLVDGSDASNPNIEWVQTAGDAVEITASAANMGLSGTADAVLYNLSFYNATARGDPAGEPFFSGSLPGLASGENSGSVSGTWPAPNAAGDHYVAVIVDPDNALAETDEENNVFVLHFTIGPDIVPTGILVDGQVVTKSPSFPIFVGPGEVVDIKVNATNMGFSGTGTDFLLGLYNGTWSGDMLEPPYHNVSIPQLSAFGSPGYDSGQVSVYWIASAEQGLHYVVIHMDVSDLCGEAVERNNFWVLSFIVSPDLVPNNITAGGLHISSYPDGTVTLLPGQGIMLGANAMNSGKSGTGVLQFAVAFYNVTVSGQNMGLPFAYWDAQGPLDKNGFSQDLYAMWTAPYPDVPTDYYINISVDSDFTVSEADEGNNYYLLHIVVDAPDLTPDRLAVEGVGGGQYYISENPLAASFVSEEISLPLGVDLVLTLDVINVGGVDQTTGTNVIFYNTSYLLGPQNNTPFYETPGSWVMLGGRTSPQTDQTSEVGQTITAVWPNPGAYGLWYINITVNPLGGIPEFNTNNNTFTIILNVTDYPVTSLTALPSYSSLALYVDSTTELNFTAGGENPPFYTYYK